MSKNLTRTNVLDTLDKGNPDGLTGADLRTADCSHLDLSHTRFIEANMEGCDLFGADLSFSNFHLANLHNADLTEANLYGANWDGLIIQSVDWGTIYLVPTYAGWQVTMGKWRGSLEELRALHQEESFRAKADEDSHYFLPEDYGLREAYVFLMEAHARDRNNIIALLQKQWGKNGEKAHV